MRSTLEFAASAIVMLLVTIGPLETAAIFGVLTAAGQPRDVPCGISPSDWCPSPPGDRCGRHPDAAACRADPLCEGMRYRGVSMVSCIPEGQGFWRNCPAVGCISRRPQGTGTR